MATRRQAEAVAERHGVMVDVVDIVRLDVTVPSPDGKKWLSSDAHVIVSRQQGVQTKAQVWADAIDAMNEGTEDCTDAECDTCHPIEEEP